METRDRQRAEVLRRLVVYKGDPATLANQLASFGWDWDSDRPLVVLRREDEFHVLTRFRAGELSAEDLTAWAGYLEMREDLGIDKDHEQVLSDAIFWLANPEINFEITQEWVVGLMTRLTS